MLAARPDRRPPRHGWLGRLAIRFVIALVTVSLLSATAVAVTARTVHHAVASIPHVRVTVASPLPAGANYLVVGSDSRQWVQDDADRAAFGSDAIEGGRRSDTIMVAHIEPDASRAVVVSFPRDLWVDIPGRGPAKLNSAYNDGPQALVDTLRAAFGIDVNHYVEVDFPSFIKLVDTLGTVPVYVPYAARDEFTGLDVQQPGCVAFDGRGALSWVRSRHLQYQHAETGRWATVDPVPDIGRISRQQQFVRTVADLAVTRSLADPRVALAVLNQVAQGLRTDAGFDARALTELLDAFRTSDPDDPATLTFATLPWHLGPMQSGQSVLYVDEPAADAVLDQLRSFTARRTPAVDPASVRVRVVNASGRTRLGSAVAQRLQDLGFDVVDVDDRAPDTAITTVRPSTGALDQSRTLLGYLGSSTALASDAPLDPVRARRGRLVPVDVELVLGTDFTELRAPSTASSTPSSTTSSTAVSDAASPVPDPPTDPAATTTTTLPAEMVTPEFGPPAERSGC